MKASNFHYCTEINQNNPRLGAEYEKLCVLQLELAINIGMISG